MCVEEKQVTLLVHLPCVLNWEHNNSSALYPRHGNPCLWHTAQSLFLFNRAILSVTILLFAWDKRGTSLRCTASATGLTVSFQCPVGLSRFGCCCSTGWLGSKLGLAEFCVKYQHLRTPPCALQPSRVAEQQ